MPKHPQQVPPIYQPEVAAKAIVWAATHPDRRELLVAPSTVATVWGNKLLPGLLDRYLARGNIDAQQTDEPLDPSRADYLFAPIPGDHGSHGIFDDQAHGSSAQLVLTTHRRPATIGLLGLAGLATTWLFPRWRRRRAGGSRRR